MKFEAKYLEENVNVSRRDYFREFLKLAAALLIIITAVYLILGLLAEQLVTHLPIGMEKVLGKAFSKQIDEKKFSQTQTYAQGVLNRLVSVSPGMPLFDYRVDIVESEMINAIALPAGRIIIFRGLVEKLGSEEALAMVLGHELGHYAHRDHLRGFGRGLVLMAIGVMVGGNGNVSNLIMPSIEVMDLKFSRTHESNADHFAIESVFKAYGHVSGAIAFYDILEKKKESRWQIPLFSTHPLTGQRKADLLVFLESRGFAKGSQTPLPGDGQLPFIGERQKEKKLKTAGRRVN